MEVALHKTVNRPAALVQAAAHPVISGREASVRNSNPVSSPQAGQSRGEPVMAEGIARLTKQRRTGEVTQGTGRSGNTVLDRVNPATGRNRESHFESPYIRRFEGAGIFSQQEQPAQTESIARPERAETHDESGAASDPEEASIPQSGRVNEGSTAQQGESQGSVTSGEPVSASTTVQSAVAPLLVSQAVSQRSGPLSPAQSMAMHESENIRQDSLQSELQVNQIAEGRKQQARQAVSTTRESMSVYLGNSLGMLLSTVNMGRNQLLNITSSVIASVANGVRGILNSATALVTSIRISIINLIIVISATVQALVQGVIGQILGLVNSLPIPSIPGIDLRGFISGVLDQVAGIVLNTLRLGLVFIQQAIQGGLRIISMILASLNVLLSQLLIKVVALISSILRKISITLNYVLISITLKVRNVLSGIVAPLFVRVEGRIIHFIESARSHAIQLIHINRNRYLAALSEALTPAKRTEEVHPSGERQNRNPLEEIRQLGRDSGRNNRLIVSTFQLIMGGIVRLIQNILVAETQRIVTEIESLILRITDMVNNAVQSVLNMLLVITGFIQNFLSQIYQQLLSVMDRIISFVSSLAQQIADSLLYFIRGAYTHIRNFLVRIVRTFVGIATGVFSTILDGIGSFNPVNSANRIPRDIFNNPITQPFPRLLDSLFRVASRITTAFVIVLLLAVQFIQIKMAILGSRFILIGLTLLLLLLAIPVVQMLMKAILWLTRPRLSGRSVSGIEHHPGGAFDVAYSVPLVTNNIQASRGEKMIFGVEASDTDKSRPIGMAAWTVAPGRGPYETTYEVAGEADLLSAGSGTKKHVVPALATRNIYLFISEPGTRKL